jgi:hypothetical protein
MRSQPPAAPPDPANGVAGTPKAPEPWFPVMLRAFHEIESELPREKAEATFEHFTQTEEGWR